VLQEPPVDRSALHSAVQELYGVVVDGLRFIPVGWASAGYELRSGADSYFLKLWPGGRSAADAVARLPLIRQLHAHGLRARVPYPVATRQVGLSASLPAGIVALFPFLPGTTPPDWPHWPDSVLDELGRTLAELHAATPALASVLPPRERFGVTIGDELRPYLSDRLLKPFRANILEQLDRLQQLQQSVRRLPERFVVCHTDLLGDNVLVDEQVRPLSALDWDGATVAPPERDLAVLLLGEQPVGGNILNRVLAVYPRVPLELDLFAFFLLRRYVEDYTARVIRLYQRDTSGPDAQEALEGMRLWGWDQWARLDDTLDLVRDALSRR
jgi:Ser/Thr protein kinase RdoA (MazF antagonist)